MVMRSDEMVPSYRVTELTPPEDRRNFIVKRYHQTWLERQLAKLDRLWCRIDGGDPVTFKPPFCWKCKRRWPDLDQLWSCPGIDCTAIDEKARARWREVHKTKSSGGMSTGLLMMLGLGIVLMGPRAGRKILSSWGRK